MTDQIQDDIAAQTQLAESSIAPTAKMRLAHRLTLVGFLGLVVLIPVWNLVWYPSAVFSNKVLTGLWLFPLVFPAMGLLKAKAYTHAWSGFIAVIYICHALASMVTNIEEMPAILLELILVILLELFLSLFLILDDGFHHCYSTNFPRNKDCA